MQFIKITVLRWLYIIHYVKSYSKLRKNHIILQETTRVKKLNKTLLHEVLAEKKII